jgi:hypothetical protein
LFEERAARNEALFRQVNEESTTIQRRWDPDADPFGGRFRLVCECAHADCTESIIVPRAVYEQVRANPRAFIVTPGHVQPQIEHVLLEEPGYVIVEKDTPTTARIAENTDTRS